MASIIVEQKVFQEVRDKIVDAYDRHTNSFLLKKLCQFSKCVICVGFWSGAFITWTGFDIFHIDPLWDIFYGALLGSFGSYVGLVITSAVESFLREKYGIEV
jgi:hypothetical protein